MELLVIIGIIVLVAAVLFYRKAKGTDKDLDTSTGNPSANDDND
ncbi:hypothetical protein [Nocardia nepalensis]